MALTRIAFAGTYLLCITVLNGDPVINLPASPCFNSSDCYPSSLNGTSVLTKYINCSNQKCVCSDCFYATNSYKSCAYQRCWEYDKTSQTCNDLRKDQQTAFLLSIFLSALGAANFYIERYDLAGAQLAVFVLLPFILCGLYCVLIVVLDVDCIDNAIYHHGCNNDMVVVWLFFVFTSLWVLLIVMWWVADMFTFAEDLRVSGDGCPLKHNL